MVILHAKIHNINQLCKHFGIFFANQGQNHVEFVVNQGQELNIMCKAYSILHPPQIQFFQVFGILDNTYVMRETDAEKYDNWEIWIIRQS